MKGTGRGHLKRIFLPFFLKESLLLESISELNELVSVELFSMSVEGPVKEN